MYLAVRLAVSIFLICVDWMKLKRGTVMQIIRPCSSTQAVTDIMFENELCGFFEHDGPK
jgi:hypothetical protein